MSDPMAQACAELRKTQTRRTRGLEELNQEPDTWAWMGCGAEGVFEFARKPGYPVLNSFLRCPYGQPGDRLWVREAHVIVPFQYSWIDLPHTKNPNDPEPRIPHAAYYRAHFDRCGQGRWRPSIHMPRWASRTLLEIVEVIPQRLHQIKSSDVISEGITSGLFDDFAHVWDKINGWNCPFKYNPWVWKITFEVLETKP